jgi:hypothetical protein
MWIGLQRDTKEENGSNFGLQNVNYYELTATERIHILDYVLTENYEIYTRDVEDYVEVMVYDKLLCDYYDEEQSGRLNLFNFWGNVVCGKLAL